MDIRVVDFLSVQIKESRLYVIDEQKLTRSSFFNGIGVILLTNDVRFPPLNWGKIATLFLKKDVFLFYSRL